MARTPSSERPPAARDGNTTSSQEYSGKVPRLPHERDESADSQPDAELADSNRAVGRQAHEDERRGLRDTTRGEQADETYRRLTGGSKR